MLVCVSPVVWMPLLFGVDPFGMLFGSLLLCLDPLLFVCWRGALAVWFGSIWHAFWFVPLLFDAIWCSLSFSPLPSWPEYATNDENLLAAKGNARWVVTNEDNNSFDGWFMIFRFFWWLWTYLYVFSIFLIQGLSKQDSPKKLWSLIYQLLLSNRILDCEIILKYSRL